MDDTCIVLVRPQLGENIGASARAMANFGLKDLRIVSPRDGWPNQRAQDMASGAFNYFQPSVFNTLKEALADCQQSFATTARKRDLVKDIHTPESAAALFSNKTTDTPLKTAFVFGAERTGLTNEEVSLCTDLINIPTNPDFSSLNLSQAVLLICYELSRIFKEEVISPKHKNVAAQQSHLYEFLDRLESELETHNFFRAKELKPTMVNNIRGIFMRPNLSEQELKTLHGIVSALIGNKTGKQ